MLESLMTTRYDAPSLEILYNEIQFYSKVTNYSNIIS